MTRRISFSVAGWIAAVVGMMWAQDAGNSPAWGMHSQVFLEMRRQQVAPGQKGPFVRQRKECQSQDATLIPVR